MPYLPKGDPLDNRYVRLDSSMEFPSAGEGLFAREDIPPDTVFALYGGHILDKVEMENFRKEESEANRRGNISASDPVGSAKWKYRHNIPMCDLDIDIPPEYGTAGHFRATLGHKINHKFDPTTIFVSIDSARFGMINALKTKSSIEIRKGEELSVNYGYSIKIDLPWFKEQFEQFQKKRPQLAHQMMDRARIPRKDDWNPVADRGKVLR